MKERIEYRNNNSYLISLYRTQKTENRSQKNRTHIFSGWKKEPLSLLPENRTQKKWSSKWEREQNPKRANLQNEAQNVQTRNLEMERFCEIGWEREKWSESERKGRSVQWSAVVMFDL